MEAPDKLYFGRSDKGILDIYSNREDADEIEYICTDAFIEKACNWLLNNLKNYSANELGAEYLMEDFKKYMEE